MRKFRWKTIKVAVNSVLRALSHLGQARSGAFTARVSLCLLVLGLFVVRRVSELHHQSECGGVVGLGEGGLYDVLLREEVFSDYYGVIASAFLPSTCQS